jgi:hypothetical protein
MAAVVVHCDTQVIPARQAIERAMSKVPQAARNKYEAKYHEGFVYHTTDLVGRFYEGVWDFDERVALIHEMMGIRRDLGIPAVFGFMRKAEISPTVDMEGLNLDQFAQMASFGLCINAVGVYLRKRGVPNELGMVIAEKSDKIEQSLQRSLKMLKSRSSAEIAVELRAMNRNSAPEPLPFHAREILGPINFASKDEDALLWLADACAFGFRRFISRLKYGEDYGSTILGEDKRKDFDKYYALKSGSVVDFHEVPPGSMQITYSFSTSSRT